MSASLSPIGESVYAPMFRITTQSGAEAPPHVLRDVREVVFEDSEDGFEELPYFEFTLADWDPILRAPKYSSPREASGAPRRDGANAEIFAFEPGQSLSLSLGYYDTGQAVPKLKGVIASLMPSFPAGGTPQMKVRVLSDLFRLLRRPAAASREFENQTDTAIARALAEGLGLRLEAPAGQEAAEEVRAFVMLGEEPPLRYLLRQAKLCGYMLDMRPAARGGAAENVLYFGPADQAAFTTWDLTWGETLERFDIALRLKDQVGRVTVKGTNPSLSGAARNLEATASLADLQLSGPERKLLDLLTEDLSAAETVESHPDVGTQAEAEALAQGLLRARLNGMVTAEGETVGLPAMRAGDKLRVEGIGPRWSGIWAISKTTHRVDSSGYRTSFSARLDMGRLR